MRAAPLRATARHAIRACLFAIVLLVPAGAWAQTKIAVIDLRRAVADTEDGLRVKAKLRELYDTRQAEYEAKEKALAEMKSELEQMQKNGANEAELRKKYAEYEKRAVELQRLQVKTRREMQAKEQELMLPIVKQMLALVRRLASKNSYDMVLNKEMVPYFRSDLDITDRVIQMYNARQMRDRPEGSAPSPGAKKRPAAPNEPGAKSRPKQ